MTSPSRSVLFFAVVGLVAAPAWTGAQTRPPAEKSATPTNRSTSTPRGAAKGVLPDPALLDGSSHPAEKRPEYGMVGDFELPGDENAKNGRVGGPQNQPPPQPGQGGTQGQGQGGMLPMPPSGGAGQQAGVPPPPTIPQQSGAGGGPENPDAAGKQVAGGQQGGQPQGQQVAELQGQGGGPEQGQIGEKPPQVSIGDSAMQIQTVANAPSIVGQQQQPAGKTQQHEKTTGSGGKGPTGSNSNKGTERGRTMPAGL